MGVLHMPDFEPLPPLDDLFGWLPPPEDLVPFTLRPRDLQRIVEWKDLGTFDEVFSLSDGPSSDFAVERRFCRDGKNWMRVSELYGESCADIEILPNGYMGEIKAVPPIEAVYESRFRNFIFFPSLAKDIASFLDYGTFQELLDLHDGPFRNFSFVRTYSEGDRHMVRMIRHFYPSFVDIELLPNGLMGEIRPVPPMEAIEEARRTGWHCGLLR